MSKSEVNKRETLTHWLKKLWILTHFLGRYRKKFLFFIPKVTRPSWVVTELVPLNYTLVLGFQCISILVPCFILIYCQVRTITLGITVYHRVPDFEWVGAEPEVMARNPNKYEGRVVLGKLFRGQVFIQETNRFSKIFISFCITVIDFSLSHVSNRYFPVTLKINLNSYYSQFLFNLLILVIDDVCISRP